METMTIDTLGYTKRLEIAGVSRPLAEAHAEAVRDELLKQVVAKAELDAGVAKLDSKIDAVAASSKSDLDVAVAKLDAKIGQVAVNAKSDFDVAVAKIDAKVDTAVARIEAMMLRQSVAIILGVLAAGSFSARVVR